MIARALMPCRQPACGVLVRGGGYCERHAKKKYEGSRGQRLTAAQRGYGSQWRKARAHYLAHNPYCAHCKQHGITTLATVVDHIAPHRGDQDLFWRQSNWQPLCLPCHRSKTAAGA